MKQVITVRYGKESTSKTICDDHAEEFIRGVVIRGYSSISITSPDETSECEACTREQV